MKCLANLNMNNDIKYMRLAFLEAKKAYQKGEVPVGCVIVQNNEVIAKAHNLRETKKCVIMHAEVNAIVKACKKVDAKFLDGATLYVTLEPCLMCAGTIIQSRIARVVYGASEPKFGVAKSIGNVFQDYPSNHRVIVEGGIMEDEISSLMKQFFKELRALK